MGQKRGIPITAAGTKVAYAVETTAGTMPTSALRIPDIKSIPNYNAEPENLETTDLSCEETKTFTPGLKDLSGANSFKANLTKLLLSEWDKLMEAYETAKASGLKTWFFVIPKGMDKCVAFTGQPSNIGLPGVETNAVYEVDLYVTVEDEPQWTDTIPTVTDPT